MKIMIKRAGQPLEIVETDKRYRCDAASEFLPKVTQDSVIMSDDNLLAMICDEDGFYKELPYNFLMETTLGIQPIVGDVVFIRSKPLGMGECYDFEVDNLTPEDMAHIRFTLSGAMQDNLKKRWNGKLPGIQITSFKGKE